MQARVALLILCSRLQIPFRTRFSTSPRSVKQIRSKTTTRRSPLNKVVLTIIPKRTRRLCIILSNTGRTVVVRLDHPTWQVTEAVWWIFRSRWLRNRDEGLTDIHTVLTHHRIDNYLMRPTSASVRIMARASVLSSQQLSIHNNPSSAALDKCRVHLKIPSTRTLVFILSLWIIFLITLRTTELSLYLLLLVRTLSTSYFVLIV